MFASMLALCLVTQVSATGTEYVPIKIGFVDRERLYEAPRVEKQLAPIRDEIRVSEAEFEGRWDALLEKMRDFESKKDFMDEEAREEKEVELKGERDGILKFLREKQEAIDKGREEVLSTILVDIRNLVRQVAQEQGYGLVLWKSAVAYGDPEHNLTEKVMKLLLEEGGE